MPGLLCAYSLIGVCDADLRYWSLLHAHTYTPSKASLGCQISVMWGLHLGTVLGLHQWIMCSHAGTLYLLQKYHYVVPQGNSVCVLWYIGWEES